MNGVKLPTLDYSKQAFSKKDLTVLFVLGGPGAGKGTQCGRLADHFSGFEHISAGDLLREEKGRPDSVYSSLINAIIADGKIVPMEITISLLQAAMTRSSSKRFLIDGFPRSVEQGIAFERTVCECAAVIVYECPEEVLERRLIERGKSSGRVDDNIDSIRKRFDTYVATTLPVLEHYKACSKVVIIDSNGPPDIVFQKSCLAIQSLLNDQPLK